MAVFSLRAARYPPTPERIALRHGVSLTLRVSQNTGVLAFYEPAASRPTTFIPRGDADFLVQRLVAERVSRRVIRLLAPDSVFHAAKSFPQSQSIPTDQIDLVRPELPGLRFVLPRDKAVSWLMARRSAAIACCGEYQWG